MTKEERFVEIAEIMRKLDRLNSRMYAYCDDEWDILEEVSESLTHSAPSLWQYKEGNWTQCYSNMYSKLLLAYLVSEIKAGNIFSQGFLEEIAKEQIETWINFDDDLYGYQMSSVLENVVETALTEPGVFKRQSEYVDVSAVCEAHYDDREAINILRECIIEAMPCLADYLDMNQNEIILGNLEWAIGGDFEFEVDLEVVE